MANNFYRKEEGQRGEDIAAAYLQKHGYKIIERNFRIRGGEIDIIALDGETLVFVEVKTRRSDEFGTPFEAITPWKLRALSKSAQFYVMKHPNLPELLRIDAVGIIIDNQGNAFSIELVKNIS